ncbi:hypothetical protein DVH24_003103 [Malus domestica]|uniref:Protein kinase domain-containing protein n=1 Tax=Malus domestica TaxID=3750 RepID=A0A498KB00_MALDO|nr:hypothetical protein DVH24_003103 [Malus domestica]
MVVVLFLLKLLLFELLPCATPLSFNFSSFPNGLTNLFIEGDAFVDGTFLRLTKSDADISQNQSVGRATYSQTFLLRENATGKLADFTTNFTFVIDSVGKTPYGDGLAFFLAPNGSLLNTTISQGGALGLPVINPPNNESTNLYPFVAVEFDIFTNLVTSVEDPVGEHVGIDINSLNENEFNNSAPVVPVPEPNPIVVLEPGNGVSVGLVAGLVVGLVLVRCICWRKGKTGGSSDDEDFMVKDSIDEEFEKGMSPKKFSYKTLAQSMSNFDEGEKLGEGGFGGVYRGFGRSRQGMKEYAAEVRIISRLRHRNLVQLIGWCHEKGELLLVYEFMSNGSLDSHLFKPKTLLHWEARYRIAQGLVSGWFYLHEEWVLSTRRMGTMCVAQEY